MKIKFIVNPVSGFGKSRQTAEYVSERLKNEKIASETVLYFTKKERDAYREAFETKSGEFDCVVAVGGDGTVNEVIEGIIGSGSNIPLAILSSGTVNDFCSSVGLPKDVEKFCDMLRGFEAVPIDVGECGGRHFVNVAACGGFADVAYSVPSKKKNKFGKMAYYFRGVTLLPKILKKKMILTYENDGKTFTEETFLFIMANTTSVGGFKKIAPKALVDDGKFDVCIIKNMSVPRMVPLFASLMFGRHINSKKVIYFQTDYLSVSSVDTSSIPVDLDGEEAGILPLTVKCVHGGINLVVPPNAKIL